MVVLPTTYAVDFPYDTPPPIPTNKFGTITPDTVQWSIKDSVVDPDGPIQKLIKVFLPNRPTGEWVLSYIQYVINIALSLVAFIAIIVLIYGFYGILFTESQEGIKNAQKTVKWSIIAIVLMGASWIIVKFMFYLITQLQ
jgi:Type IV secretion system pilin